MLRPILFSAIFFYSTFCFSQTKDVYNLDFEKVNVKTGLPVGWGLGNVSDSTIPDDVSVSAYKLDANTKQAGKYSLLMDMENETKDWTCSNYVIRKVFSGKSIKLTGYLRTENVTEWAGLWMRIDGEKKPIEFDNMEEKHIKGTNDWKEYTIILPYDQKKAKSIVVGGLIVGKGKIWLDNFHLSIDSVDISGPDIVMDTVQHITLDTLTVTAPAAPPIYRAFSPRVWEIKNTRVALSFNWKEKTADAKEWITMHPYFYATDTIVLDAKSMRIDSVILVGKDRNKPLNYSYKNNQLKIDFGHLYKMEDNIELYFKYTAMPYAESTGGSGAIRDDRGLYFINTDHKVPHKPAEIWTQGETESNSHWLITIDKPNTRFTTQIELTVPDSCVTLSNGAMIKQVKDQKGMRTDIWKMDMPMQTYVVMFAVGKFSVVKNSWRGKEVNYYVEPEYQPYASLMFNHTPEMLEFFSKRTGVPYPWNKYSQVVVRDYVSGAMENTSAALFGEFMNQNAREIADRNSEDVVSHELFHEWFGDYVTCKSWTNITVNESFANYGEQLWRYYKYGKASADELGYNDLMGYIGSSSYGGDPQLVRFHYDSREDVFDAISYNKGGAILRYLNYLIGDAAFDRAMYLYLTKNALQSAEAHNWRMAVEEATGQDWNWFFNQWYFHAGHPIVKVVYNYNDTTQKLAVAVTQNQEDSTFMFQLPLKTAIIYGNEKIVTDWNITRRRDTFIYEYKNGIRPVIIPDYAHVLPGEIKDGKKMPQWKVQFAQTDDYVSKRLAVSAAGRLLSDTNAQAIIDMGLKDKIPSIRRTTLSSIRNTQNEKYRRRWTEVVMSMAINETDNLTRAEAIDVLGEWKVANCKTVMITSLHHNSYAIAGAGLGALNKLDADTAYILAKQFVNTDCKAALESAVWSAIGKKAADDDIVLFEAHAPYFLGTKKFTLSSSLSAYLKNVKSEESYKKGVEIFAAMVSTEGMKTFRPMLGGYLFQLANNEKDNLKSDNNDEVELAKKRLQILKPALQKVADAETDEETITDYKKKMKDIFEKD